MLRSSTKSSSSFQRRLLYVFIIFNSLFLFILKIAHYHYIYKTETSNREIEKEILWHDYPLFDIDDYYNCSELLVNTQEQILVDEWVMLRETYIDVVGKSKSSIGRSAYSGNAFKVKYNVKESKGRGRGVFANQYIPKGEKIHSSRYTAEFDNGASFTTFLLRLPPYLACDVADWAYLYRSGGEKGEVRIMVELDDASLCNNGGGIKSNIDRYDVSIRDINEGEEILCDHTHFYKSDSDHAWAMFGLVFKLN